MPRDVLLLSAWQIDTDYVEKVVGEAQSKDFVSFDIFDTALTRIVDSPVDVFAEVERRLLDRFGTLASGFATMREDAEREARGIHYRKNGADEIGFDAIYQEMRRAMPHFAAHLDEAAALEMQVEREVLVAVPDILAITRRLSELGKPFLFVSDMYLPASFLAEVLHGAGYEGWSALYVSCETGRTKSTGRQWPVIAKDGYPLERLLHVGDDEWSDVHGPWQHGVKGLAYVRARSERRLAGVLKPSLVPFSYAQRAAILLQRAAVPTSVTPETELRDMGKVFGAIVVGSFLRWLEDRVQKHGLKKLYFCARDGWLMRRAWKAAGLDVKTGVEDHYLHISRRPLNLSCGYLESTDYHLPQWLLNFLSKADGGVTIERALRRIGLQDDAAVVQDMVARFGSLDAEMEWDGTAAYEEILRRHIPAVRARLHDEYVALMGYLHQENMGGGERFAVIDMGWHGTMQRSLRALLEAEQGAVPIHGFYYGLWPAALGNLFAAGPMEAAFANAFVPTERQPEVHAAVDILEELHSAPHGSVKSYRLDAGRWEPVFTTNVEEVAQYASVTRHFQEGVLQAVGELFREGRSGCLTLEDLTPDAARSAMAALCMSPSAREIALLGKLVHCAHFDHSRFESLSLLQCPENDEARRAAFWRSAWRMGTLRHWYASAAPEHKPLLRDLAREAFAHYGERNLRHFQ